MPIARFQMPDGRIARFEVPEGTSPEQAQAMISDALPKSEPTEPVKIGADAFPDILRQTLQEAPWGIRNIAGAGTALSNVWEGAKQFVGQGDKQRIAANKIIEQEAPVGAFAGNAALTAIPFAAVGTGVKAAGLVGAGYGALQPVEGEQTATNVAKGKLLNTAIGGATGAAGQAVANKAGDWMLTKASELAALRSKNAPLDATIKEALDAGYVIPPGNVNPSFLNRQLESMSGKIATQQLAGSKNQEVTDMLARRAAGLSDNTPITPETLRASRDVIKKPYQDIAALGLQGKLDALDAARAEARSAWSEYSVQKTRSALNDYAKFSAEAKAIEQELDDALKNAGKNELMEQFRNARSGLAKNHDVETALVEGGGSVDARAIARMFQRGSPMTGDLKTIGSFANNFPRITQPDKTVGTPDAHNLKYMLSLAMGGGGAAAGDDPKYAALGVLPLLSGPAARQFMFSKPAQQALVRDYTLPLITRMTGGLLNYSPVAATALGVPAFSQ